jgi:hypothetical protein
MSNIMAQRHDIPHETYEAEALDGRSNALGRLISQVFHPILVNIASFLIVGYASASTHAAGLRWAGICILTLVLPPTIFYSIRLRQGAYADEDVSVREQRNELSLLDSSGCCSRRYCSGCWAFRARSWRSCSAPWRLA